MPSNVGGSKAASLQNAGTAAQSFSVKSTPGRIEALFATNIGATGSYWVKIYDKATAPTTADIPILVYVVTAAAAAPVSLPNLNIRCVNGIGVRVSGALPDNDATALGFALAAKVVITYK